MTNKIILKEKQSLAILEEVAPITFYTSKNTLYFPMEGFYKLGASIFELDKVVPASSRLEAIYNRQKVEVVAFVDACEAFTQLNNPIFSLLADKLFVLGIESACKHIKRGQSDVVKGVKVYRDKSGQLLIDGDSFGYSAEKFEEFKNDAAFWQKKLDTFEYRTKKQIEVRPHPMCAPPKEINGKEMLNLHTTAFMMVDCLANPENSDNGGSNVKNFLKTVLEDANIPQQYNYFLYSIRTGDQSVCLLTQTLIADHLQAQMEDSIKNNKD